ncbi:MAG: malonyl-ACP O-methyltransferase BioC [Pseudomonadota bacterium]
MNEYKVDKLSVRRAFDRAAQTYDQHAMLQALVREEMLRRLAGIKLASAQVLVDMGCGTGAAMKVLRQRYPRALVLGLDFSLGMLHQARRWRPWVRKPGWVCGDMERLPLRDASVDVLFSSLSVQWGDELAQIFAEARRVLKPGGVFMFSTLGPDTLKELREAWRVADFGEHAHVNMFYDMHDVGDALLRAGMRDPVMDVERITLRFADVEDLMRSLKSIGARNSMQGRARGLTTRARLQGVRDAYEHRRGADGALPVTYEVVHGLAWGAEARRYHANAAGEVKVPLHALRGWGGK